MSRDKSVWFAEEILLDGALIHYKLETGEWLAVEEMLRAEAQLSRDPETGRLRPKKASEYTLRLIGEFLHMMRVDITQNPFNISTLAVAEQCLRLIRSCAAYGMKIQTYICKDLNILDDMLALITKYQHHYEELVINENVVKKFDSCMVALTQTLGNLVVNNPFNQIIIWDKLGSNILNGLIGQNEKIASCCAMIVYNILLGQPNVLPDDVLLLNALAYMYTDGNSEFPHLIIEYLIGVESSYIEKLYNRLDPETRLLILNIVYNILTSFEMQDSNVSVNFIKFISHEFKMKSDCILKTVDKYINSIEPQEIVYLLDIISSASSMDVYMDCLQNDTSLFINCAFLLRSIHQLGKQEDNFFTSIHKLYNVAGRTVPENASEVLNIDSGNTPSKQNKVEPEGSEVKKCDSADMLQCNETVSECTESESSEQYFECTDQVLSSEQIEKQKSESAITSQTIIENQSVEPAVVNVSSVLPEKNPLNFLRQPSAERKFTDSCKIDDNLINVAFAKNVKPDQIIPDTIPASTSSFKSDNHLGRKHSLDQKGDFIDDMEPPLITDSPEEANQNNQKKNSINMTRKVSLDINIGRKENYVIPGLVNPIPTAHISRSMSRQHSVEPAMEISEGLKDVIPGIQQEVGNPTSQPVSNIIKINESSATLTTETSQNIESSQLKTNLESAPPKKSQNITSDFDLSEQLQKILGISSDKAIRTETLDVSKETHGQSGHKSAEPQSSATSSIAVSPSSTATQNIDVANPKPRVQMRVPNVKIDSPENNQKTKSGNFENSGPKKIANVVESVEQHVAFGFKATLIKTLGNLCWKNQINKRQIRELEVIPILLDCCNIDARNPLIMQWVILAVRNLCENCPENQALISSMTLQEPIDNELLEEMGLTLHTDTQNNKIKLVPLLKKEIK